MSKLSDSIAELRTNDEQWTAFQAEGHCVVLAAPGSGKTKLLTTRVASDLLTKIPRPHGAACITLTNPATDELRRRLQDLGVEHRSTLFVGTVHSFALRRIVLPFARTAGQPELAELRIANKQQQDAAFNQAICEVFDSWERPRYIRSTIEVNRRRMATPAEWALSGEDVQEAARRYEELLRSQGLIDFDDVVTAAVNFVEQHQIIRRVLTGEYPRFYVDEYQDLAPGLDRLVQALCFDYAVSAELFAVGDPDQAVFGFTGSRPELLIELAHRNGVTSVRLDRNYRSGAEIIRIANRLRPGQHAVRGERVGGSVTALPCPQGFDQQCQAAADAAVQARDRGVPLHEIVAICPTNDRCQELARTFRQLGLPAAVRGSEYRLTPATLFVEGCAAWTVLGRETSHYRLAGLLGRWHSLLGARWDRQADVALTALLLDYANKGSVPAIQLLEALLDIGLLDALTHPALADDAGEIARMLQGLAAGSLKQLTVHGLGDRARRVDRVEVTTMTSSKGLEFDVVLILGMDQGAVPHFSSMNDPEQLQEERRKFYVSLTRARDEVQIFYSGFTLWPSGDPNPNGPSQFLGEIGFRI
jgi:DNA helicase II / ATP-dependent DNA helicase PcrA